MKNVIIILYLIVSGLLAAGCSAATEGPVGARLGEEFTIAIGEEAVITGEDLGIRFEEVIEDSRCPLNVECPWAGQARYTLSFTQGGASESAVVTELGLGGRGQVTVFDYEITAQLGPYPEDPGDIVAEDYYLDLTVKSVPPSAHSLEEQADIYAAVIRQLYEVDHTFGSESPEFPKLYLVYMTDDSVGGNFETPPVSHVLPEPLRTSIKDRLSDLPAEINWVGSFEDVPLEENSSVMGGGAVIRLGNIVPGEGETVEVAGSIYVANLAAGGRTYVLEKQDGTWKITGNTGPIWIS